MNEAERREKTMLDLFDWITDFVADRDDVTADDIRLTIAKEFADGPRERDLLLAQYRERAWHAESQLETRYGLRREINTELGLTDETGDEALRKGLETIRAIKAEINGLKEKFEIAMLCWRCNNLKRDATPTELKTVTDWLWTVWGNEVEVNDGDKAR